MASYGGFLLTFPVKVTEEPVGNLRSMVLVSCKLSLAISSSKILISVFFFSSSFFFLSSLVSMDEVVVGCNYFKNMLFLQFVGPV